MVMMLQIFSEFLWVITVLPENMKFVAAVSVGDSLIDSCIQLIWMKL